MQKGKEEVGSAEAEEANGEKQAGAAESLVAQGLLDKQSSLYRAAVRIQARYRGYVVRKVCLCGSLQQTILKGRIAILHYSSRRDKAAFNSRRCYESVCELYQDQTHSM